MSHVEQGPLSAYNSLTDRHLAGYFSATRMRRHLRRSGLVNKRGEIVTENTYRLNMAKKEHKKHVKELLAQAIVNKTLDLERQRQHEIGKKLEEIAKLEVVRRVRAQSKRKGDEEILPYLSPRMGRPQSSHGDMSSRHRSRSVPSSANRNKSRSRSADHYELDTVIYMDGEGNLYTKDEVESGRGKDDSQEIDPKHLYALNTEALKKYASLMKEVKEGRGQMSPYLTPQVLPTPPKTPRSARSNAYKRVPASPRSMKQSNLVALHPQAPPMQHRGQIQTMCEVTMKYFGPNLSLPRDQRDPRQEVIVEQQHCGGNTLTVFRDRLLPGSTFSFFSRRHRGFPFSLSLYVEGRMDSRVSTCCEYRHAVGNKLGGKLGHFGLVSISGTLPCYKCQAEKRFSNKKSKPSQEAEDDVQEEVIVERQHPDCYTKGDKPNSGQTDAGAEHTNKDIEVPVEDEESTPFLDSVFASNDKDDRYEDDFEDDGEEQKKTTSHDDDYGDDFEDSDAEDMGIKGQTADIPDEDEKTEPHKDHKSSSSSSSDSDSDTDRKIEGMSSDEDMTGPVNETVKVDVHNTGTPSKTPDRNLKKESKQDHESDYSSSSSSSRSSSPSSVSSRSIQDRVEKITRSPSPKNVTEPISQKKEPTADVHAEPETKTIPTFTFDVIEDEKRKESGDSDDDMGLPKEDKPFVFGVAEPEDEVLSRDLRFGEPLSIDYKDSTLPDIPVYDNVETKKSNKPVITSKKVDDEPKEVSLTPFVFGAKKPDEDVLSRDLKFGDGLDVNYQDSDLPAEPVYRLKLADNQENTVIVMAEHHSDSDSKSSSSSSSSSSVDSDSGSDSDDESSKVTQEIEGPRVIDLKKSDDSPAKPKDGPFSLEKVQDNSSDSDSDSSSDSDDRTAPSQSEQVLHMKKGKLSRSDSSGSDSSGSEVTDKKEIETPKIIETGKNQQSPTWLQQQQERRAQYFD